MNEAEEACQAMIRDVVRQNSSALVEDGCARLLCLVGRFETQAIVAIESSSCQQLNITNYPGPHAVPACTNWEGAKCEDPGKIHRCSQPLCQCWFWTHGVVIYQRKIRRKEQ